MSSFIKSSAWNVTGNVVIKLMSFIAIPFLSNYYIKGDIAILRSVQALIALLFAVIPMGTNFLYISEETNHRDRYWNLLIITSGVVSVIIFGILFFTGEKYFADVPFRKIFFSGILLFELIKAILSVKLISEIKFKYISIALVSKQLVFNILIVVFCIIKPTLNMLIIILLFAELVEICVLLRYSDNKLHLIIKPFIQNINFDKKARKYVFLSGGEALLVNLAIQIPNIAVLSIMGDLAVEFQLPLVLVAVPSSLIMRQVSHVITPYISNNRDDETIHKVFKYTHYIFAVLGLPLFWGIAFFAQEISGLMFNPEWKSAYIALQFFPIFMFVNMFQNPMSSMALIKNRPVIGFVYSLGLLTLRLAALKIGYSLYGFYGAVVMFTAFDSIWRSIRLIVDLKLVNIRISVFIKNLSLPLIYNSLAAILCLLLLNLGCSKEISYLISISLFGYLFIKRDLERIKHNYLKIRNGLRNDDPNHS